MKRGVAYCCACVMGGLFVAVATIVTLAWLAVFGIEFAQSLFSSFF